MPPSCFITHARLNHNMGTSGSCRRHAQLGSLEIQVLHPQGPSAAEGASPPLDPWPPAPTASPCNAPALPGCQLPAGRAHRSPQGASTAQGPHLPTTWPAGPSCSLSIPSPRALGAILSPNTGLHLSSSPLHAPVFAPQLRLGGTRGTSYLIHHTSQRCGLCLKRHPGSGHISPVPLLLPYLNCHR